MSLIGKINVLKMDVMPKLLYLFQNLQLPPPSNLFSHLKKLFVRFICRDANRPMVKKERDFRRPGGGVAIVVVSKRGHVRAKEDVWGLMY